MPKPKRFKILKSVGESTSLAASLNEAIAHPNSAPVNQLQQPETCPSTAVGPSVSPRTCPLQTPPQMSQTCPSTSAIPTSSQSSDPASSLPAHVEGSSVVRRYAGRESSHYWFVDAIGM